MTFNNEINILEIRINIKVNMFEDDFGIYKNKNIKDLDSSFR